MKASLTFLAGGALAVVLGLAGAAQADAPAKPAPKRDCFMSRDWAGWHAPDENTLYLRINVRDIFRVDLSSGSKMLLWPDVHLVNQVRGSDMVCSPIDLDLHVSESGAGSFNEFLIAKSITKLTPEQVAAIPKKDLP